jgi:hypothetical protein
VSRFSPLAQLLALLLAAALAVRPLFHGVEVATILAFWAIVLGELVVPGVLLARGLRLVAPGERGLLLGQGATLGLALQGLALLAGRALGAPWLTTSLCLAAAAAGFLLGRRPAPVEPAPSSAADAAGATSATLAVTLVAVLLLPLASAARPAQPLPLDLLFHSGVAAELRHRWPLEDPRVAGVALHYHLLAYALPVAASELARAPVADSVFALAPLAWLALVALQMRNAGCALFGSAWAGAAAAAVVLFHVDPGRFVGLGPGAFNSFLATGIYGSPTTLCGLVLLCGFALSLDAWLLRHERRQLVALGLLAAAASAAKTTVLPVPLAALALAALVSAWRGRRVEARRIAAALGVAALCGAPFTLWQNAAAESYSAMAGLGFAKAFSSSGFASWLARSFGGDATRGLTAAPAFVVWLIGYLGLAGVAAGLWLVREGRRLSAIQTWALSGFAAGLGASLLLDVPGLSQLFFAYNGQLLLGLFAGAELAWAWRRPRGTLVVATLVVLALAALPNLEQLARALPAACRQDAEAAAYQPSPVESAYAAGLGWLRAHASRDAVVFADNPSLRLSALGEVRLYYENGIYTPRAWRVGPGREPWPERVALQERLLRRPDAAALAAARHAVGPGPRLLVVADAVQSRVDAGFVPAALGAVPRRRLFPQELFALRFVNDAMQVYEARE